MKTIRNSIFCLSALLCAGSVLRAQDFSRYRVFTLGTSLTNVLKLSDQRPAAVKVLHDRPVLIQELTWWPPSTTGTSSRPDSVEQVVLSFYNGELYKLSVTYDYASTKGLTTADMVESLSSKYGPPTSVESRVDPVLNEGYNMKQDSVASWQDSPYFLTLVRSSFPDRFGLVLYSKKVDAEAELSIAAAVKLEEQERPEKEAEQKKKEADDLEAVRLKNQKTFHP